MYFPNPFASIGDRMTIPPTDQGEGAVSIPRGWGEDYSKPTSDPDKKNVERTAMNGMLYDITDAIGKIQRCGYSEWSAVMQPYGMNCRVMHNARIWQSTITGNNDEPSLSVTSWRDVTESTIPDATESAAGAVRIASQANVLSGTGTGAVTSERMAKRYEVHALEVDSGNTSITINVGEYEYVAVNVAENVAFTINISRADNLGRTTQVIFDKSAIGGAAPAITINTGSHLAVKPVDEPLELTAGTVADALYISSLHELSTGNTLFVLNMKGLEAV